MRFTLAVEDTLEQSPNQFDNRQRAVMLVKQTGKRYAHVLVMRHDSRVDMKTFDPACILNGTRGTDGIGVGYSDRDILAAVPGPFVDCWMKRIAKKPSKCLWDACVPSVTRNPAHAPETMQVRFHVQKSSHFSLKTFMNKEKQVINVTNNDTLVRITNRPFKKNPRLFTDGKR